MATYADLSTAERIAMHDEFIRIHKKLRQLNYLHDIARTSQERTALRAEAIPLLQQAENLGPDDFFEKVPVIPG